MSQRPNSGQQRVVPYDQEHEEVFHIAGDVPDPTGQSNIRGYQTTMSLDTKKKEVTVRYRDYLLTVDVYQLPETPTRVILLCPKCRNALSITADRKAIDFDPRERTEFGGRLSVEAFQCTWEGDSSKEGRRMDFGLGLCGWKAAIDNNVAKDA